MINDRLLMYIKGFEYINERICHMRLRISGQDIMKINCHAPTIKGAFYAKLERIYDLTA